ncbi:hypothetical protein STRDD11_00262 [Streptococcus sp. DD11]|nr:hypothetical protein STRDD11_00262 [Streptococcus sp. DD11]
MQPFNERCQNLKKAILNSFDLAILSGNLTYELRGDESND